MDETILWFDFSKESFGKIRCPPIGSCYVEASLAVIDKSLALTTSYIRPGRNYMFEIWLMNEYGAESSWAKKFKIGPQSELDCFIGFWGDDEIVGENEGQLVLYNLQTQQVQRLQIYGDPGLNFMFGYAESLVPLGIRQGNKKSLIHQ
ncbi:F-box protein At5g41490-like [Prosopis cineraria]|uniref:F-box protein At5g41490-like n=1 Tax=Prosopis cineraria TaxID=364024 RepID=UPI0024105AE0|nr:F-box protein At5g41490-like [Prosopis cineraria]